MNNRPLLSIDHATPANGLLARVLAAVYQKQEQSRLWRVRIFASSALLSVAALVPVVMSLIDSFKASNFSTYVSLLFSDSSVVLSYWKILGASLVESLPTIGIGAALALVAILLWSIQKMVRFMNTTGLRTV